MKHQNGRKVINYDSFLFLFLVGLYLSLHLSIDSVQANQTLNGPQLIIQNTSDKLQENLRTELLKSDFLEAFEFVDDVISPHIDIYRISYLALGKHWRVANDQQKSDFQKAFKTLILRTYTRTFLEYAEWSIRYLSSTMNSKHTKSNVRTHIINSSAAPLSVNYRMKLNDGSWQIYDVITDGVSLVKNYRTSFYNEIKRGGSIDTIISRLTKLNNEAFTGNGA